MMNHLNDILRLLMNFCKALLNTDFLLFLASLNQLTSLISWATPKKYKKKLKKIQKNIIYRAKIALSDG